MCALANLPDYCPDCLQSCARHAARVRDAMMWRAAELASGIYTGISYYLQARRCGVLQPQELIDAIYADYDELAALRTLVEPDVGF